MRFLTMLKEVSIDETQLNYSFHNLTLNIQCLVNAFFIKQWKRKNGCIVAQLSSLTQFLQQCKKGSISLMSNEMPQIP